MSIQCIIEIKRYFQNPMQSSFTAKHEDRSLASLAIEINMLDCSKAMDNADVRIRHVSPHRQTRPNPLPMPNYRFVPLTIKPTKHLGPCMVQGNNRNHESKRHREPALDKWVSPRLDLLHNSCFALFL